MTTIASEHPISAASSAKSRPMGDRVRDFLGDVLVRIGITFKWSLTLAAILTLCALLWRALELYEVSVKAQSVEAQIALEKHRLFLEALRNDGKALTPEQVKEALAGGARSTPVPFPGPVSGTLPAGSK